MRTSDVRVLTNASSTLRACAAVLCCASAQAAQAAMPLATDDAGTVGAEHWQLELASQYSRDRADGTRTTEVALPLPAIAYGILESLDVVVGGAAAWTETRAAGERQAKTEMAELGADVKWRFLDREPIDLALKVGAVFPTAEGSTGDGSYHALLVVTSEEIAGGLHLNVGYTFNADQDGVRRDQWLGSVALQVPARETLSLVGEVGIEQNPELGADEPLAFAQVGGIYSASELINLDAGIRRGLTDAATDWSFALGCTIAW